MKFLAGKAMSASRGSAREIESGSGANRKKHASRRQLPEPEINDIDAEKERISMCA
ncbi:MULTISPECIES: hypothetical protein [Burkholderia]|uniref:Uncharacterized protein n=1 Tax=Burkholderia anthina TaxID=179879 RepID=A0A7T7AJV5_9BURK|nr:MULTISPECIES: hypothetical protein [Burkholderia]QQK05022.1 hypothetical protein JFN94_27335 [Burkholderia anthina]